MNTKSSTETSKICKCPHCLVDLKFRVLSRPTLVICPSCLSSIKTDGKEDLTLLTESDIEKLANTEPTVRDKIRLSRALVLNKRFKSET